MADLLPPPPPTILGGQTDQIDQTDQTDSDDSDEDENQEIIHLRWRVVVLVLLAIPLEDVAFPPDV